MAAPSAQTLQRIAAETRLPAATLEKVLRLLDVLQAIAEDRDLKARVARIDRWSTRPCCASWSPRATRSGVSRRAMRAASGWRAMARR